MLEGEVLNMHIAAIHSHLGGYEHIIVHRPGLWSDLEAAIAAISPADGLTRAYRIFGEVLQSRGWQSPAYGACAAQPARHMKERLAVALHYGQPASIALDLFAQDMAWYAGDIIDAGIEVLPVKRLQDDMPPAIAWYEGELHNLTRRGRSVPAVPLVLIGMDRGE